MSRSNPYAPRPWVRPSNYIGATWEGWLVFLGRNRDSDLLTNHNFETALADLEACEATQHSQETEDAGTIQTVRENHWAVGWVEWIAIHPSNEAAVRLAEDLAAKLDAYPVLDEDRFSEREWEEACASWDRHDVESALMRAGAHKRTIDNLPSMDRDDAAFIREEWTRNGADYETVSEGSSTYFRMTHLSREAAAWAIRWLRGTA